MLAVQLTSFPGPLNAAARQAAALGFAVVDVVALAERPADDRDVLAETGLAVSCAALGRGLPAGAALDAVPLDARRAAVDVVTRHLRDAAELGATTAYLVPGSDPRPEALTAFADSCRWLADIAQGYRIRLCVEHFPGRALPTVSATLSWLEAVGHENLRLLLDAGHCLISGEEPAEAALRAGPRLGYVHLDDNDGQADLHWPLLTGRLTRSQLEQLLEALRAIGYRGAIALELNGELPRAVEAVRAGKELIESLGWSRRA
ncbi:MAG: sugar phosphate isomerase/epimerase [Gemmataceae bacterium]|nr:sugar phosphate isomerase/epimerase [Gemmataceae bacterium]MDW8267210.1 sugar phosphate isomerase/epimerase family protein [Gemmataceae bacterium]